MNISPPQRRGYFKIFVKSSAKNYNKANKKLATIYKLKSFDRGAKKEKISDEQLMFAVREIERGLVDVDLGRGLYKKRVARKGSGKRSGYRTLLAFKSNYQAIFLFGFAKNEQENIGYDQLFVLKKLADEYLSLTGMGIRKLVNNGRLIEVKLHGDKKEIT